MSTVDTTDEVAAENALPIADLARVRGRVWTLMRQRRGMLTKAVLWFMLATAAGLAVPAILGDLVEKVERGITTTHVNVIIAVIAGFVLVQTILTRVARLAAARLGEFTLAELRESFISDSLALPLLAVERAGTGDLLSRSSRDVETLSHTVRLGAPSILTASLSVLLTLVAMAIVSPILMVPLLVAVPVFALSTRWYLRRANAAYLRQSATYSDLTDGLAETVSGARTVEALGLAKARRRRADTDIARSYSAERRTLYLRSVWFPMIDMGYSLPLIAALLCGGILYTQDVVSLGEATAAVLYTRALIDPLDELLTWLDELQTGGASLARILGVGEALEPKAETARRPRDAGMTVRGVRHAYHRGRDVVVDVDLDVAPGERLAIVGPSGAGKSTLGRILSGVQPPQAGRVIVGGVPIDELSLADRRSQVALVTQENHVFRGTVRDNIALARPDATNERVLAALATVDAESWVTDLPDGLDTGVGAGGHELSSSQAQQLALARLVLADPRTLVLDEATSLMDPKAARHLERSLSAVLADRTVIAIAHRLHTAHDADRIAVMEDGRITELGDHAELLAAGGAYARLWDSWHGRGATEPGLTPR